MNKSMVKNARDEIVKLKNEIKKLEESRDNLEEKIDDLYSVIIEKEISFQIYDYYDAVRHILQTSKNYERHFFDSTTATRDLMTHLKRGKYEKEDYVIKDNHYVSDGIHEYLVDYYIVNNRYILLYSGTLKLIFSLQTTNSYTVTQFKQRGILYGRTFNNIDEEIIVMLDGFKRLAHLYDNPIELQGQTYDDMDYRKEFYYGELEYEGSNYGNTSTFYFVDELV